MRFHKRSPWQAITPSTFSKHSGAAETSNKRAKLEALLATNPANPTLRECGVTLFALCGVAVMLAAYAVAGGL